MKKINKKRHIEIFRRLVAAFRKSFFELSFLSFTLLYISCDTFFEKAPGVDVTQDTIFSTVDRAELYLLSLYTKIPDGYFYSWADDEEARISGTMLSCCTDQAESGWSNAGSHQYNAGSISQYSAESVMEPK